jgi:hypothetical protein
MIETVLLTQSNSTLSRGCAPIDPSFGRVAGCTTSLSAFMSRGAWSIARWSVTVGRLLSVVASLSLMCSTQPVEHRDLKECRVKLLPGYQQREGRSLDSTTGYIFKEGGLRISYDMAGVYTDCDWCDWTKGETWRKKQVVNGQQAVLVFTKSRRLVVSFPESHANFYATIRDESELTDMLLMLATFEKVEVGDAK